MNLKIFNAKRKVFCTLLVIFSAFSYLPLNSSVLAMRSAMQKPGSALTKATNPFVDITDEDGWTLLMRAIQEYDLKSINQLLNEGADLYVMPPELQGRYSNAFEYLCDIKIRTYSGEKVAGKYESIKSQFPPEVIKIYCDMVDTIIKHCIENHISLSISTHRLNDHADSIETVWDYYARERYWDIGEQYHFLFQDV